MSNVFALRRKFSHGIAPLDHFSTKSQIIFVLSTVRQSLIRIFYFILLKYTYYRGSEPFGDSYFLPRVSRKLAENDRMLNVVVDCRSLLFEKVDENK